MTATIYNNASASAGYLHLRLPDQRFGSRNHRETIAMVPGVSEITIGNGGIALRVNADEEWKQWELRAVVWPREVPDDLEHDPSNANCCQDCERNLTPKMTKCVHTKKRSLQVFWKIPPVTPGYRAVVGIWYDRDYIERRKGRVCGGDGEQTPLLV